VGIRISDTAPDADCAALQQNPAMVRYFPPKAIIQPFARFTRVDWDVSEYKGKQGVIEILDSSTGWYLEVDDFRQDDSVQGTPVDNLIPSYYSCNHNTVCEPALGEAELWCTDDCPPPTSCRVPQEERGFIDYTIACGAFKLTTQGLLVSIVNTGTNRENPITLHGLKCTLETLPDPSTYTILDQRINVGESLIAGNGTIPCYDEEGAPLNLTAGDKFGGRLFYNYEDVTTDTTRYYIFYGKLNIDAVVRAD
jgi:hypothetical protein